MRIIPMVTSQATVDKIRKIVEKHYSRLALSVLGKSLLTPEQLKSLKDAGYDTSNTDSLLALCYYHNFINSPITKTSPTSVEDMSAQQSQPDIKPEGEANDYTVNSINDSVKQFIDKIKADNLTRIEGIIRQNNDTYKFDALRNLDRTDFADQLAKESSLGRVKQLLRDTSGEANRDWQRVALTEMSNAIGIGSVDRIVTDNRSKDPQDVYVFRIIVADSVTCKFCRKFYGDVGQPPKIYRLSTLLANGSNYGLKSDQWRPVVGATHPNTRTSQIMELKPGFMVKPGGVVSYIGLDKWQDYINQNLVE